MVDQVIWWAGAEVEKLIYKANVQNKNYNLYSYFWLKLSKLKDLHLVNLFLCLLQVLHAKLYRHVFVWFTSAFYTNVNSHMSIKGTQYVNVNHCLKQLSQ